MAPVSTHGRVFTIGRDRLWIVSGSVPYFRIPAGLWRDRLQKSKWAGLNTIETPVPWNWHEPKPGKFDFRKDADLEGFLKAVRDAGLYAIVRVGPYIGADWEFGGLPPELAGGDPAAPAVREADPRFLERVEAWFAELLPRLAKLQVHLGGSVIAVGSEHEYLFPERPRGEAYIAWLHKQIRGHKIEVPVLGCSSFPVKAKGAMEIWVDGEDAVPTGLTRLGELQPNLPKLVTQLCPGGPDRWGAERWSVERRPLKAPRALAAQALRILAEGGMYNISPFAAGSDPGFWSGRLPRDDFGFPSSNHESEAPVAEGGGLTANYFAIKTVNQFAESFSGFLAAMEPARLKTEMPPGFSVLVRRTSTPENGKSEGGKTKTHPAGTGTLLFVFREFGVEDLWADLSLPKGLALPLDFTRADALPLAYGFQATPKVHIEHCNLPILGTFLDRFVFFHGPAGSPVVVSANGKTHEFNIPAGVNVEWREAADGHFLVFLNTETAEATWFSPDRVTLAAALPGEKIARAIEAVPDEGVLVIPRDGNPVHHDVRAAPVPRPPRRVGNWRRLADIPEIRGQGDGWRRISGPAEAAALGVPRGYVWYRVKVDFDRKRSVALFLPGAEDRVHVWLNGKHVALWGRGPGAVREPVALDFEPGPSTVVMLADNLGRFSRRTPLTDRKGVFEPLYHGQILHLPEPVRSTPAALPREVRPTWTMDRFLTPDPAHMTLCEMHFSQPQGSLIHVEVRQLPEPCWVFVNDTFVGFFHGRHQAGFHGWTIPAPREPLNHLRAYFPSRHQRNVAERFRVCDLAENLTERADWAFKPWGPPDPQNDRWSRELKDDSKVRWYAAQFPELKAEEPVFLDMSSMGKGQILLNGRNLARYWSSLGPQTRYHLPAPYLAKTNELLIFEEEGRIPDEPQLEFDPLGPFGDPHAPKPPTKKK
jgi:hypothetical protein